MRGEFFRPKRMISPTPFHVSPPKYHPKSSHPTRNPRFYWGGILSYALASQKKIEDHHTSYIKHSLVRGSFGLPPKQKYCLTKCDDQPPVVASQSSS